MLENPGEVFGRFEDELIPLLDKHFAGEPDAVKALALSVALGDLIGRSTVTIEVAVEIARARIREAAMVQRELTETIMRHMVSPTETRQ